MSLSIGKALYYLSVLSPLLPLFMGIRWRQVLWYYALASFLADATTFVLKLYDIPHALVSNIFLLAEFVTITAYFKTVLIRDKFAYTFIAALVLIGLVFCYRTYEITLAAPTDAAAFNYADAAVFYICYIVLSLAGLYRVMSEIQTTKIEQSPLFLASVAFLLYASGALFPFLYKNIAIAEDMKKFKTLWAYFFLPLNIIKNILIAFSLRSASAYKHRELY